MTAIIIGGEKGGTGKSTLATNLSVMASLMGKDVLLLDTDKQASSANFIERRNEQGILPTPTCVKIAGKYVHKELENLYRKYELIIIDAGGRDSVELRAAMASPHVSKIYSPIDPGQFDLETVSTMDSISELARSYNEFLKAYILFNKCPTHAKVKLLEDAYEYTKDIEHMLNIDLTISARVPFKYAAIDALSVVEYETERLKAMKPYQAKKYIPKSSIEIINLYEHALDEKFNWHITSFFTKDTLEVEHEK